MGPGVARSGALARSASPSNGSTNSVLSASGAWVGVVVFQVLGIESLEDFQLAQELTIPLGNPLAAVNLDEVGVIAQDLQDLACFRPSLGYSASLVLDGDTIDVYVLEWVFGCSWCGRGYGRVAGGRGSARGARELGFGEI